MGPACIAAVHARRRAGCRAPHASALSGDAARVTLREQFQSSSRERRPSRLGVAAQLRARPGNRRHDDRKLSHRADLAPDARLPSYPRRFAAGRFPRRLAIAAPSFPGSVQMQQSDIPSATLPQDAYERERMENARPAPWRNPKPAGRYHLVVIGGGPAGLVAARVAASMGAKVALVERALLGGGGLNVDCIPSKAIIRTSRLYAKRRNAEHYGAQFPADIRVDFPAVMQRMRRITARVSRFDSAQRLSSAGVDVFLGVAHFTASDALSVDGTKLRFRKALVATGARPDTPSIPGLAEAGYLTNENVFDLTELPRRLLVIGGGPLGCELAQAFCRLGARTSIAQSPPLFLPKEERDAAQILSDCLARDGIDVRLNTEAVKVRVEGGRKVVDLISDGYQSTVTVDAILTGTGRLPNVERLNVDAAGIDCDATTGIRIDDFLRTSNPRIYAAGDACLEHKLAHTADASARNAVHNAVALGHRRLSALTIPWCTYTDPRRAPRDRRRRGDRIRQDPS